MGNLKSSNKVRTQKDLKVEEFSVAVNNDSSPNLQRPDATRSSFPPTTLDSSRIAPTRDPGFATIVQLEMTSRPAASQGTTSLKKDKGDSAESDVAPAVPA